MSAPPPRDHASLAEAARLLGTTSASIETHVADGSVGVTSEGVPLLDLARVAERDAYYSTGPVVAASSLVLAGVLHVIVREVVGGARLDAWVEQASPVVVPGEVALFGGAWLFAALSLGLAYRAWYLRTVRWRLEAFRAALDGSPDERAR